MTASLAMPSRALALALLCLCSNAALAQQGGPAWQQLSPQQRTALAPLEREWGSIDEPRKRKWLDIADRLPKMSPDERERVQNRMSAWSQLSPDERGRARQRYQEAREVSPQERQQRWEAYQSLPPERRRELAQGARARREGGEPIGSETQRKSNIVTNPSYAAPAKAVAPTMLQARPGATTTLMSRPPVPPAHQQTGLPKIAATPGFVDRSTLLPQRGPQGAAASPIASPAGPAARRAPDTGSRER
jgi:hypothetical protein